MKVVQINGVCGVGSTGRIAVDLSKTMSSIDIDNFIFYGEGSSNYPLSMRIGNDCNIRQHQLLSRITGKHSLFSSGPTQMLINNIEAIKPDIIHLHNIHAYYLNIKLLFEYIKSKNYKVFWTLHDCWAFTGHCAHFDYAGCSKWLTQCEHCPNLKDYPISWFWDRSKKNYVLKKELFTNVTDLTIITPSDWLRGLVKQSFLGDYKVITINNGIDIEAFQQTSSGFREKHKLEDKFVVLCVNVGLQKSKGRDYMLAIADHLDSSYKVVILGVTEQQKRQLPSSIIGITKRHSIRELAEIYSAADVYVNPTLEDNFPTTNLESLACGTPVITFNTGGSIESINELTGLVVTEKSLDGLLAAIKKVKQKGKGHYSYNCIKRAKEKYNKNDRYLEYIQLYTAGE